MPGHLSSEAGRSATGGYGPDFYGLQVGQSRCAAEVVVPLLVELLHPASVLDIGCGVGAWLAEFVRCGITDVVGVDGSHLPRERLQIPAELFVEHDLSLPLDLGRRFDVVLSLEVAEHLEPGAAPDFVRTLTSHADLAVFSAAIPGQGGTNHVNEQWPRYWVDLFGRAGWQPFDLLRPRLWDDPRVGFWYRQNVLLFASPDGDSRAGLSSEAGFDPRRPPPLVHPEEFQLKLDELAAPPSVRAAARLLGRALSRAARCRWNSRRERGAQAS